MGAVGYGRGRNAMILYRACQAYDRDTIHSFCRPGEHDEPVTNASLSFTTTIASCCDAASGPIFGFLMKETGGSDGFEDLALKRKIMILSRASARHAS